MVKLLILIVATICFSTNPVVAQEDFKKNNANQQYELMIDKTNNWVLLPWEDPETGGEATGIVIGPTLPSKSNLKWFVEKDQEGTVKSVWGTSKDDAHPSSIDHQLPKGSEIIQEDFTMLLAGYFSKSTEDTIEELKETIQKAIINIANSAVEQVCSIKARPTKFSLDTEIKVSLGIGGTVKIGMEWETKDLCTA